MNFTQARRSSTKDRAWTILEPLLKRYALRASFSTIACELNLAPCTCRCFRIVGTTFSPISPSRQVQWRRLMGIAVTGGLSVEGRSPASFCGRRAGAPQHNFTWQEPGAGSRFRLGFRMGPAAVRHTARVLINPLSQKCRWRQPRHRPRFNAGTVPGRAFPPNIYWNEKFTVIVVSTSVGSLCISEIVRPVHL